jgi:hypothetical protein
MSDDGSGPYDEDNIGFEPLEVFPTMRLNDIARNLAKPSTSVVNLDALIPPREAGELVLQSLLYRLQRSIRVLSLRFNTFSAFSIEVLIDYIMQNDFIEILYLMGCGFDEKTRKRFEDAWKKNMTGHRTDNMGFTFIRVSQAVKEDQLKVEAAQGK